jgi:chemotaxis response regulator CheB
LEKPLTANKKMKLASVDEPKPQPALLAPGFPIVGTGASAGGLEALEKQQ